MRWLDGVTDSIDMHLEKTLGDSEGQGSLVCCSPRGHKESDTTLQLNNKNNSMSTVDILADSFGGGAHKPGIKPVLPASGSKKSLG